MMLIDDLAAKRGRGWGSRWAGGRAEKISGDEIFLRNGIFLGRSSVGLLDSTTQFYI